MDSFPGRGVWVVIHGKLKKAAKPENRCCLREASHVVAMTTRAAKGHGGGEVGVELWMGRGRLGIWFRLGFRKRAPFRTTQTGLPVGVCHLHGVIETSVCGCHGDMKKKAKPLIISSLALLSYKMISISLDCSLGGNT